MTLKLKKPHIIEARYTIVTPMFIGDAEKKATGISPASVKGALRFWWRALNWGRIYNDKNSDKQEALKELHKQEADLFGSSSGDGEAAKFKLQLDTSKITLPISDTCNTDWPIVGNNLSAYLGIGLWKTNKTQARQYISEGKVFDLSLLSVPNKLTPEQIKQLNDTLLAWGLCGGLGSRSRRAFGSVAIESLNNEDINFSTIKDYSNKIEALFNEYRKDDVDAPPFSAISKNTKFSIYKKSQRVARSTHADLGQKFKSYRGTKDSPVRGKDKWVFGFPFALGEKDEIDERRASPLLFHIHPIGKKFISAILFLPADFHFKTNLSEVDYSVAENFLTQQDTVII